MSFCCAKRLGLRVVVSILVVPLLRAPGRPERVALGLASG